MKTNQTKPNQTKQMDLNKFLNWEDIYKLKLKKNTRYRIEKP